MVFRKRKQPTPDFKLPPPFQPQTGERAPLQMEGIFPHCAMMQVVEDDTHCNYVVCRGWDPRNRRFFDYEEGDGVKIGFPVAKPYSSRFAGVYRIGQVLPAILPLPAGFKDGDKTVPQIGQNPGRVDGNECQGHPLDLDTEVVQIEDDSGISINWMLLDTGPPKVYFTLTEELLQFAAPPGNIVDATLKIWDPEADSGNGDFACSSPVITIKVGDLNKVGHNAGVGGEGSGVMHERVNDPYWVCVIDDLCCPGDEQSTC